MDFDYDGIPTNLRAFRQGPECNFTYKLKVKFSESFIKQVLVVSYFGTMYLFKTTSLMDSLSSYLSLIAMV